MTEYFKVILSKDGSTITTEVDKTDFTIDYVDDNLEVIIATDELDANELAWDNLWLPIHDANKWSDLDFAKELMQGAN